MYSVPHLKNGIFSMPERKPTRTADLDYFYGQSSELFSFYRIPKLLFQDSRFQPLSTDAKTLYPDYRKARNEMQELVRAQKNVERFFAEEKENTEKTQTR